MQASWMILASLFFATMSVCIKFAASHFNTFELVFYRGLIGMVVMASLCRAQGSQGQGCRENVALKHEESPFVVFVRWGRWLLHDAMASVPGRVSGVARGEAMGRKFRSFR